MSPFLESRLRRESVTGFPNFTSFFNQKEHVRAWRYASAVYAMAWCLSVSLSQASVLSKRLNESKWFFAKRLLSACPTLRRKEFGVSPKIRVGVGLHVLSCGTLSHTLNLADISASFAKRHVDRPTCCQLSLTDDRRQFITLSVHLCVPLTSLPWKSSRSL